jgi:TRAP-type mannitol/chloroaromatic compound transport system permease small subunit
MDKLFPKKVGRAYIKIISILGGIATAWLFGIMFLMTADILGRVLFNHPVKGASELIKTSIVAIVFMQIPYTLWVGRHIRSELVISRLKPATREILLSIMYLFGAGIFLGIIFASWDTMITGWKILEYEGEGALRVPVYPIRTIIVLGSALTAVLFIYKSIESILKSRRGARENS